MAKVGMNVSVDDGLPGKIERAGAREGRTLSNMAQIMLIEGLVKRGLIETKPKGGSDAVA